MTLILHRGAEAIDYAGLRALTTPEPTATHLPIHHHRFVDLVVNSLAYYGHVVSEQHYGVTPDGNRFFGVLKLRSPYTAYEDMLGLRNSHDKSLPVGIAFGSSTFVCDNLAFSADHVIRTKHTAKLKLRLPGLVGELIEPIALEREAQHKKLLAYQETALSDRLADHLVMELYRHGVISVTKIADVLEQWERPVHDHGAKTYWRFFNAITFVLTGRVSEDPRSTTTLHRVLDGFCETVH
jgi:hypothetical protein